MQQFRVSSSVHCANILALGAFAFFVVFPASAATPISSSIALETYAKLCDNVSCDGPFVVEETSIDSDSQGGTLGPLSSLADAEVGSQTLGADATLQMSASFSSVSSGSTSFSGDVGMRRPDFGDPSGCSAQNNSSQGFEYTFVSSANGFLTVDYNVSCAPIIGTTSLGAVVIFLDGSPFLNAFTTPLIPTRSGIETRPIQDGETYTLRVKPDLGGQGGSCGVPPEQSWSCTGSVDWSFDAAQPPAPVPSPAGSLPGILFTLVGLMVAGLFAMRRSTAAG